MKTRRRRAGGTSAIALSPIEMSTIELRKDEKAGTDRYIQNAFDEVTGGHFETEVHGTSSIRVEQPRKESIRCEN